MQDYKVVYDEKRIKEYGLLPSPPDARDFSYQAMKGVTQLPSMYFMDRLPIRDQGRFGTCVGYAASAIKDRQERVNHPGRNYETSPLYVYSECKRLDGIPNVEGTYPRTAMSVLLKQGISLESTMPYELMTEKFHFPSPSPTAHEEAKQFKVGAYARIHTLQEIKQAVFEDGPVMIGVTVTENFVECEKGGFIDLPQGYILGGHALDIDGWDDNMTHTYKNGVTRKGFFRVVNSWSESWGDRGYGFIPYDFVHYKTKDLGMSFFQEAWSSIDVIMPHQSAKEVIMWIGSSKALVDGQEVILDQEAVVDPRSERTLVPVRFLADAMGWKVEWNAVEKKITLRK